MTNMRGREALPPIEEKSAGEGLALLRLLEGPVAPRAPDWINRRVEQLEFLDTRAIRWRISVDFVIPEAAPLITDVGGGDFKLVPITSLAKTDLVAFDLRDEDGRALWLPTSEETGKRLASAFVYWACQDLKMELGQLPGSLVRGLTEIVLADPDQLSSNPPAPLAAATLIEAKRSYRRARRESNEAHKQLIQVSFWQFRRRRELQRRWARAQARLVTVTKNKQKAEQHWRGVEEGDRLLIYRQMARTGFRKQVIELSQNFVVNVGVTNPPKARRILKLTFESAFTFRRPSGRLRRFWQSLGWRCWTVDVLIGGRGGSHHLEVAAPAGVDIVGITANPVTRVEVARWRRYLIAKELWHLAFSMQFWYPAFSKTFWRQFVSRPFWRQIGSEVAKSPAWLLKVMKIPFSKARRLLTWVPTATVVVPGGSPHVHIRVPASAQTRYRAAIFVQVSRPGWLSASLLVALVISVVMLFGWLNTTALFARSTTGETGTAATLLLTLLGVFAVMLVSPREHPLASRLLRGARALILADALIMLVAAGNLVLHNPQRPVPVTFWAGLAIAAGVVAGLVLLSWLLPVARLPHRKVTRLPHQEISG
jgi:hypothetical protein